MRYAFAQGVTIATLTDGVRWRLYLPTQPGSWRERRFFTIHLFEQAPQDVATNLRRYLSKTSVLDGTALKEALAIHESRAKERQIREALLAAWRKICEEPDARLIELLSEQVESRCGHTPDPQVLAEFIVRTLASWPPPPPPDETDWTFRKPRSYTFRGQQHAVSTFKDILVGLCTTLHDEDPLGFWSRVRNRGAPEASTTTPATPVRYRPRDRSAGRVYTSKRASALTM